MFYLINMNYQTSLYAISDPYIYEIYNLQVSTIMHYNI